MKEDRKEWGRRPRRSGDDAGLAQAQGQASRAPDRRYRTAPLKGLWARTKGGFFHDGRFPTLVAVVDHYNSFFGLGLTASQQSDLIEYLKSL